MRSGPLTTDNVMAAREIPYNAANNAVGREIERMRELTDGLHQRLAPVLAEEQSAKPQPEPTGPPGFGSSPLVRGAASAAAQIQENNNHLQRILEGLEI